MERLFYNDLLGWKTAGMKKPLLVLGARQVGKTYLLDGFCRKEFKRYSQINLFEDSALKQLYRSDLSSDSKFEQLQMIAGFQLEDDDTILFVDEVQESEEFISELKYLQEKHPQANIICAGSLLGVKLKRLKSSFLVGRVDMKKMYPMRFQEFLMATGHGAYVRLIEQCFEGVTAMLPTMHEELLYQYKLYSCIGGMPEAVQQFLDADKEPANLDRSFFDSLNAAYLDDMKKYVSSQSEAIKIERVYNSIPTQQSNTSHKFQYSKIRSGARSSQYETALDWLMAASMVHKAECVNNPAKPVKYYVDPAVFKLYMADVGLLAHQLELDQTDIMLDRLGQAKGLLAENYVACELTANCVSLFYWRSEFEAEVDFLLQNEDGVIPVEVKSADNVQSKSLRVFCEKYKPPYAFRVSTKNFGFENGIKSVPLYATHCLR